MFEEVAHLPSYNNSMEALVWQKDMVNKTNNNVKDGHSSSQTHNPMELKRFQQKAPTPLDLRVATPGLGTEGESYWAEVEEDESREVREKRRAGEMEEEEEEERKRQRRSPPQGSLPSFSLFTENRFDQLPSVNSTTPSYSPTSTIYSPPYPAPTFTLTPPLTPNTPQNTFTFSFPPASQSFTYNTTPSDNPTPVPDEHRFMRKILPKPLEIPTNVDSFQPYSEPLGYPVSYPSDQKFQYPPKQEPTLYYNSPLHQGHQQALLYHQQQQQLQQQLQVHQGGGGGRGYHLQEKAKQPRPTFSHLGTQNPIARQTSTPPLVTLLMEKTLGSVRRWRENGATIQVFYCCVCSMPIDSEDAVVKHVSSQHGHRGQECSECGEDCEDEEGVARHALTHKINVCRGCGKKFNTVELLGFHEKECLQCRPHRCDYCGQGFILAARLKHHRRSCHANPSPSPHSCKVCYRSFPSSNGLATHVPIHAYM